MIETLVFYMFAVICVASGVMVISARNPVHSVLFLILAFFNAAGLFVLAGAEYIAMLVLVYVGAVMVLFLFVVMMLDVTVTELKQGFQSYLPIGGAVGLVFLAEITVVGLNWTQATGAEGNAQSPMPTDAHNTLAIGDLIYTQYAYLFQAAGLVLLVAMIGAIVLTHRKRKGVRKQVIADQVARTAQDAAELKKVESGRGI